MKTSELLAEDERILEQLRGRNVLRTSNGPWADYAELLVARFLGTELEAPSTKSTDVVSADGRRVQVKCRVVRTGNRSERELSVIRSFDFDDLAIVLFARSSANPVQRAAIVPVAVAQKQARFGAHTRGHALLASDALFAASGVRDVTDELRRVSELVDADPLRAPG